MSASLEARAMSVRPALSVVVWQVRLMTESLGIRPKLSTFSAYVCTFCALHVISQHSADIDTHDDNGDLMFLFSGTVAPVARAKRTVAGLGGLSDYARAAAPPGAVMAAVSAARRA